MYDKAASERYRQAHPDRVKDQKADWYEKNRQKAIARVARWKKEHPEKEFNGHLRRKYGITREQYDAMLKKQHGLCAICGGPPDRKRFDVDHDHQTKRVRGLLCHACNVMLGQARDKIEVFQAAILYLQCSQSPHKPPPSESISQTL